jgi:hypothetical protein
MKGIMLNYNERVGRAEAMHRYFTAKINLSDVVDTLVENFSPERIS